MHRKALPSVPAATLSLLLTAGLDSKGQVTHAPTPSPSGVRSWHWERPQNTVLGARTPLLLHPIRVSMLQHQNPPCSPTLAAPQPGFTSSLIFSISARSMSTSFFRLSICASLWRKASWSHVAAATPPLPLLDPHTCRPECRWVARRFAQIYLRSPGEDRGCRAEPGCGCLSPTVPGSQSHPRAPTCGSVVEAVLISMRFSGSSSSGASSGMTTTGFTCSASADARKKFGGLCGDK